MKNAVSPFVAITLDLLTKVQRTIMKLRISLLLIGLLIAAPGTSRADNIFVANQNNNTIEEFSSSGGTGTVFGSYGLDAPGDIALDSAGNLYACSYLSNTIVQFNPSGVGSVYASGIPYPHGVLFNAAGQMFVVSDGGSILKVVGGTSSLFASTPETPIGGAFDNSGNLYVAVQNVPGSGGEEIEKFNTNGVGTVFASSGLDYPTYLAFDKNGNLYVSDYDNNTIEKFNTNGVGTVFASTGVNGPEGLAFDSAGDLFVADAGNNTIEEFSTSGVGTVFASGLSNPLGLAVQAVPEPSTWALLALSIGALLGGRRLRHRSS